MVCYWSTHFPKLYETLEKRKVAVSRCIKKDSVQILEMCRKVEDEKCSCSFLKMLANSKLLKSRPSLGPVNSKRVFAKPRHIKPDDYLALLANSSVVSLSLYFTFILRRGNWFRSWWLMRKSAIYSAGILNWMIFAQVIYLYFYFIAPPGKN